MEQIRAVLKAETSAPPPKKRRGDDSESDLKSLDIGPNDSDSTDLDQLSRLPRELRWIIIDLVQRQTGRMKRVSALSFFCISMCQIRNETIVIFH